MSAIIDQMLHALDRGELVELPSTHTLLSVRDAQTMGLELRAQRTARGERPRGYKIGFTNRTIWQRYCVDAPIFGTVWDSTVSDVSTDARISLSAPNRLSQPRIEPEIVFGFSRDVPFDATPEQVAACIDWAAHGFEIVHCHYADWKFTAADTLVDFGLHSRLLIRSKISIDRDLSKARELTSTAVTLFCDDAVVDRGVATVVLDGPFEALLHLQSELISVPGAAAIKAGDVVTTGSITDAHPILSGQRWHTQLEHSALAGLSVVFDD